MHRRLAVRSVDSGSQGSLLPKRESDGPRGSRDRDRRRNGRRGPGRGRPRRSPSSPGGNASGLRLGSSGTAHPHGRLLRLPLPGGLETEGGGRVAGARGRQPPPRPAFSARSSGGGPDRLERMNASLVSRLFGPSRPLSTRPNAEGQRTGLKRVKSGVNVVLLNGGCAASRKES